MKFILQVHLNSLTSNIPEFTGIMKSGDLGTEIQIAMD